jgi:4-amino-4-deoxy-L-arabinose transferase-like glycosyltransferase
MPKKPASGPGARSRTEIDASRSGSSRLVRTEIFSLLGLLAVALGVRVVAWHRTAVLFNDGPIFLALSDAWLEGRWSALLAHPYHPLYPAAIAASRWAFGLGPEPAAVAVSICGGLLTVLGIGLAVRWAFDREAGWMAGWVVALHPWAVDFSSDVMSDGLYAGLFLLGFAALVAWQRAPGLASAVSTGVCAGLAYLVRPEGLGLLVVAAGVGVFASWRRPHLRGRFAMTGAAGLVAAMLVCGPFLVALNEQVGGWTLTRKKSLVDLAEGRAEAELTVSMPAPSSGGALAAAGSGQRAAPRPLPLPRSSSRLDVRGIERPARSLLGVLEAVSRAFRTGLAAFRYEVAVFALLGAMLFSHRRFTERSLVFALPPLAYTGLLAMLVWGAGYVARRHALAAWLPLTAYAVLGWRGLWGARLKSERARRGAAVVLLVGVLLVVWGPRDLRARRSDRLPLRAAAEWLMDHEGPGAVIAAEKLRVAYYAKGQYVPLPSGAERPLRGQLEGQGVAWVVIDEQHLVDHAGLTAGVGEWLEVVHREEGAGRHALVLRVR